MLWTEISKNWKDVQSKFQTKWPKLTVDELKKCGGKREELIKCLVKHYKADEKKLGKDVDEFIATIKPAKV